MDMSSVAPLRGNLPVEVRADSPSESERAENDICPHRPDYCPRRRQTGIINLHPVVKHRDGAFPNGDDHIEA